MNNCINKCKPIFEKCAYDPDIKCIKLFSCEKCHLSKLGWNNHWIENNKESLNSPVLSGE